MIAPNVYVASDGSCWTIEPTYPCPPIPVRAFDWTAICDGDGESAIMGPSVAAMPEIIEDEIALRAGDAPEAR